MRVIDVVPYVRARGCEAAATFETAGHAAGLQPAGNATSSDRAIFVDSGRPLGMKIASSARCSLNDRKFLSCSPRRSRRHLGAASRSRLSVLGARHLSATTARTRCRPPYSCLYFRVAHPGHVRTSNGRHRYLPLADLPTPACVRREDE